MAAVKDSITGLYITYFNRAPDASGLAYWEAQAAAQGNTAALFGISSAFSQNSVAVTNYPSSLTNTQFVQQVYGYALNRGSAVPSGITSIGPIDAAGQTFWEGRLASGLSRSDMMVEFINAVLDYSGTDPSGLEAQKMIQNKVAVGKAFADAGNKSNVVLDNAGNPDTTSAVYIASQAVMNGVTGTLTAVEQSAKVANATSTVNALAASVYSVFAQQTSTDEGTAATFKLNTTNVANGTVVNYTLSGTGIDANDVTGGLTGSVTVNNNTATITVNLAQDQVAESNETLNIAINGQTLSPSSVSSTIINDTTGQIILTTGTSQVVNNIGASVPVKVEGDQTTGVTLNVTNAATNPNDALSVTLDKAGDATATSIVKVDNITSNGLETLNIVSSGVSGNIADNQYYTTPRDTGLADNNVISSLSGLSTSNVSQINISGASDLSLITGAINKSINISAATATGNLFINAANNTNSTTITGGSGADTLWGSTSAADTINGGDGDDVIRGGHGGDTLNGGAGNDVYAFYPGTGVDDSKIITLTSFDKVTVTSGDGFYNTDQNMTVGTFTAGIQNTAAINTAQDLLSALTQVVNAASTPLVKNSGYLVAITDSSALYNGTYLVIESGLNLGAVDVDDTVMQLIGITGTAAITADASGSLILSF